MKWLPAIVLSIFLSCATAKNKTSYAPPPLVSRAGWYAVEPRPYKQHVPVRITIHHESTRLEDTANAARKIRNIQVWGMGKDRNWTDIPYHFLIGRDGTVYEGRNPFTVGETATEYDRTGQLLMNCLGNLNQQPLPEAQLKALIELIAYSCEK